MFLIIAIATTLIAAALVEYFLSPNLILFLPL